MQKKALPIMLVITIIAIIAAIYTTGERDSGQSVPTELLFPTLAEKINSATQLTVKSYGEEIRIEKDGDDWIIANRDSYPALFEQVKSTLIALSEARLLEYKTSDPDLYYKLGVEGIEDEEASTLLVVVKNETQNTLAELLIGDPHSQAPSKLAPTYFARKPGEARSLLVEASLDVSSSFKNWVESLILDIKEDRIKEIDIRHPNMHLSISREDKEEGNFQLAELPEGMQLKSQTNLDRMGSILEEFRIDDVKSAAEHEFSEKSVHTKIQTFDGLIVKVQSEYLENLGHASFTLETTDESEDRAKVEAAALNEQLSGWVFIIPYFKYDTLARQIGPLVEDIPPASAPDA